MKTAFLPAALAAAFFLGACGAEPPSTVANLTVDYPLDGSIFPPEFIPVTILWHDEASGAKRWRIEFAFSSEPENPFTAIVAGDPRPKGEIDPEAVGPANEDYEGNPYLDSARSWTPPEAMWKAIKERTVEAEATVTITGFDPADPETPLSRGSFTMKTSKDPVGAPIFYRDVPLMPSVGEKGKISPLDKDAIDLIAWRLRDVSRTDTKLVLKGMKSCGNCHSFSLDGETLGMDVDGPSGDKGMYAVKKLSKNTVIGDDDVITWNSFPGRPEGHKTIGFLSRISPDGRYVVSTVNESLYATNFTDFRFLQVFYPTRGILAFYSTETDEIKALPGADSPEYVHCDPAWLPDGSGLIFARAKAIDAYQGGQKPPKFANDPEELPMQYDLYRMPFDGGKGGTPEPIEGASANGMSNTFPKVSPDGKWIVFVKCRNGQLMRPDSRLWIVPVEGGEAREMRCNTELMNSWHSFSPNSRWMVFSSKSRRPFTQAFLTHIDEDGNDSPAILVPNLTADNRAVNLPEFLNAPYDSLDSIDVPAVRHHVHLVTGANLMELGRYEEAIESLVRAIEAQPDFARANMALGAALAKLGREGEAIDFFERAAASDPRNPDTYYNIGFACMAAGLPVRAIDAFERALALVPVFADARRGLEAATKQKAEYEAEIERRRKSDDRDWKNQYRLSVLYDGLGDEARSVAHLARSVDLEPDSAGRSARLAWRLATSGDASIRDGKRAVALARRALELAGTPSPFGLDILAAALAETGDFEGAVKTAGEAVALAKKTPAYAFEVSLRLEHYRQGKPWRTGGRS